MLEKVHSNSGAIAISKVVLLDMSSESLAIELLLLIFCLLLSKRV